MSRDGKLNQRHDPALLARAQEVAEARGVTMTELVEEGLRIVCDGDAAQLHRALSEARRDLLSVKALVDARLEALIVSTPKRKR